MLFALWTRSGWTREKARRALADAHLHLDSGEYREALSETDAALALDHDLVEARLVRAQLLIKMGRKTEATGEARAILASDPEEWTAHLVLASAARGAEGIKFGTSVEEHLRAVEARAPRLQSPP